MSKAAIALIVLAAIVAAIVLTGLAPVVLHALAVAWVFVIFAGLPLLLLAMPIIDIIAENRSV